MLKINENDVWRHFCSVGSAFTAAIGSSTERAGDTGNAYTAAGKRAWSDSGESSPSSPLSAASRPRSSLLWIPAFPTRRSSACTTISGWASYGNVNGKRGRCLERLRWMRRISGAGVRESAEEERQGKSIVFGLLERDGRVYTKVVDAVSKEILMEVIRKKSRKGSVYYTDKFKSYNSLKRYGKHYTLNHGKTFVRKGRRRSVHINGIEGFWSFAKHGLYNYRGVSRSMFPLYLKEMEYRYNHRNDNLLNLLISLYFGGNST